MRRAMGRAKNGIGEADRVEGESEVARRLEVVAREDAEAARVDRERLVKAVLHREVGDRFVRQIGELTLKPPLAVHVGAELPDGVFEMAREGVVDREFFEALLGHAREELDGISVNFLPKIRIDAHEEFVGLRVPRPPEVVGELAKGLEDGGEVRDDVVASERRHARQDTKN